MKLTNKSGFTLLEIIIVIIIVGVLASIALPKFFRTVEYSRSTEALSSINSIRQSIERCYLQRSAYTNCGAFANLDVEDPSSAQNSHFGYGITPAAGGYTITATRNTRDGGTATDTVVLTVTAAGITKSGTGAFSGIQ